MSFGKMLAVMFAVVIGAHFLGVIDLCPGDKCVSERGRDWQPAARSQHERYSSRRTPYARYSDEDEGDSGSTMLGKLRGTLSRGHSDEGSHNSISRDYWSR